MAELSTLGSVIKTAYEAEANAFTDTKNTKLAGIETSADVTDATNVDAAGAVMNSDTSTISMSFVIDEDDLVSDSATKVPTQQSVKAYVDATGGHDAVTLAGSLDYITLSGQEITRNAIDLTADVTGDLPVADGGTGASTASDARDNLGLGEVALHDDADLPDVVADWLEDENPGSLTDVLQTLSTAIQVLTATNVATAADTPVPQTWRRYTTAGGVLVVFDTSWADDGEGVIQKISGAGDIVLVADTGVTINGASSIGDSTEVTDAVWENSSGANTEITSAGANLPDLDAGDYFQVPSHGGDADNEGWYIATGSPTTSSLPATKLTGSNPADASSETVDIDEPVRNAAGVYHLLESIAAVKRIGSDFLIQGGTNADKDFDGSNLTNFGRPVGLVEVITGHIVTADDKNYFLDQSAAYPYDIVSLTIRSETGTCTVNVDIDGTPVTSISAVSVSGTETTATATGANSVAVGETVDLGITSNSAAVDVRFTLKIART